jgi:hypothetical protein
MDIFGDLSYNKENRAFIGRPVKEIEALYKKKQEDFNYVADSKINLENAFSDLKYNDKNAGLVVEAKNHLDGAFKQWDEVGDYENKVMETKKLANNLANDFGLKAVSEDYKAEAERSAALTAAVSEGKISSDRANQYKTEDSTNYQGVQKDPETGIYKGGFRSAPIIKQTNWSTEVTKVLNGWKADTYLLTDEQGRSIKSRANGTGYIELGSSIEEVKADDLAQAAKSYLLNEPQFQSEFAEDLRFEIGNNPVAIEDVIEIAKGGVSSDISKLFASKDTEALTKTLEEQDMTPLDLYSLIRKDQKINKAIKLGVDKESYQKFDAKFVKNTLLESEKNTVKTKDLTSLDLGTVVTTSTTTNKHSVNIEKNAQIYTTAKAKVIKLEEELAKDLDPQSRKNAETELTTQQHLVAASYENYSRVLDSDFDKVAEAIDTDFYGSNIGESRGKLNVSTQYTQKVKKAGIDGNTEILKPIRASKGGLKELTIQVMNNGGSLESIDLTSYINPNLPKEEFNEAYSKLKEHIENAAEIFIDRATRGDLNITEDSTTLMMPATTTGEQQDNPVGQFTQQMNNFAKDPSFIRNLGESVSGVPIENYLDEAGYKNVDYSNPQISIGLSNKRNTTGTGYNGNFRLTLKHEVDDKMVPFTIDVFSGDKGINAKYKEVISGQRDIVMKKRDQVGYLTGTEQQQLDELNVNMYETSDHALNIDLKNWQDLKHGQVVDLPFWEQDGNTLNAKVKVFKYDSPDSSNKASMYLLTDTDGRFYSVNPRTKKQLALTAEQLKSDEFKDFNPMGGNESKDLKRAFATIVGETTNFSKISPTLPSEETLVDITSVYGKDIVGKNMNNFVAASSVPFHKILKAEFKTLQVTDLFREPDSKVGTMGSLHRVGKGVDYRMNAESEYLTKLNPQVLKLKYNIKSAQIHNEGEANEHVHVEFY